MTQNNTFNPTLYQMIPLEMSLRALADIATSELSQLEVLKGSASVQGGKQLCIAHGGGNRCQSSGCTKSALGTTLLCAAHGGGIRSVGATPVATPALCCHQRNESLWLSGQVSIQRLRQDCSPGQWQGQNNVKPSSPTIIEEYLGSHVNTSNLAAMVNSNCFGTNDVSLYLRHMFDSVFVSYTR